MIFLQFEGWDNFDERRRSKHQKQLDFRVGVTKDFDEGADKNWLEVILSFNHKVAGLQIYSWQ